MSPLKGLVASIVDINIIREDCHDDHSYKHPCYQNVYIFRNQVTWYLGNKKLVPDGTNISVTAEGTKRTLTIHDAQLKHVGEINARTNKDRSDAHLHVGILNEITKAVTSDAFRSGKVENVDLMFIGQC